MELEACRSLRESFASYLGRELEVSTFHDQCVLTLPFKTVDDRYVSVYIDSMLGDYVIVHDGGKTSAELFAQGIHFTDARRAEFRAIAERYGAAFENGAFTIGCRPAEAQPAILAVAQCVTAAMLPVLKHFPVLDSEPVSVVVKRTLDRWRQVDFDIRHRVHAKGTTPGSDHVFDSVAFARHQRMRSVAVKALSYGYGPKVSADRFGYMVLDLKGTQFDRLSRLAVISKVETWTSDALVQVRSLAADTIEARTGEEAEIERVLPAKIERLALVA